MCQNALDGRWNITIMERAQTEAQQTVPPSNPMWGYLFSFMFFPQGRTQQGEKFLISGIDNVITLYLSYLSLIR